MFTSLFYGVYVQEPVSFLIRVIIIDHFINKSGEHDQHGKCNADAEQADEGEELSPLQYRDGYFEIISKHVAGLISNKLLHPCPIEQPYKPVCFAGHIFIVRYHYDGGAFCFIQMQQNVHHFVAHYAVEVAGRFIG